MNDMETNVELEVLDDAELDEVTGGLLDFSGIRTINLNTSGFRHRPMSVTAATQSVA